MKSSLSLLVGLLVVSFAIPALAADPIKIQFHVRAGYTSSLQAVADSPALAAGDIKATDTTWNGVAGQDNNWINVQYEHGGHGLSYTTGANGAATTAGIRFEGALNVETGFSGAQDLFVYNQNWNAWQINSGVYSSQMAHQQMWGTTSIGMRVDGLAAGRYRVYSINVQTEEFDSYGKENMDYTPNPVSPNHTTGIQKISIGVNLNAPLATGYQTEGGAKVNDTQWINGVNYVVKDVTVTGPTDWITIISASTPVRNGWENLGDVTYPGKDLTYAEYSNKPTINGFQIIQLPNLVGDANHDGKVNFDDYLILESSFGTNVTAGTGADFDNNGTVNFDDYLKLEANFGTGTAVPEPMTMSLLGLGALALIRRRQA